jgi:hypothetical protein
MVFKTIKIFLRVDKTSTIKRNHWLLMIENNLLSIFNIVIFSRGNI